MSWWIKWTALALLAFIMVPLCFSETQSQRVEEQYFTLDRRKPDTPLNIDTVPVIEKANRHKKKGKKYRKLGKGKRKKGRRTGLVVPLAESRVVDTAIIRTSDRSEKPLMIVQSVRDAVGNSSGIRYFANYPVSWQTASVSHIEVRNQELLSRYGDVSTYRNWKGLRYGEFFLITGL